ncbi:Predicted flavoprotein CzcO associated with the cation diffusion facilitator CzcD [Haloechinothrix alba]|uniref:Predicted flavoprotein CzcO associated with the cation diffusion facilitator CzcD n=1 Tax=Haloechinothrix alba TaxID=664784 RepID=A0A238X7G5_9PSEU|nr:NAD(P)/FAD-dependent oxidoreductase [Haloechinothrix alba]SNR54521.1 Predicted flavoprotein CzcO associated with the cation diffusion facilitator CzcD [Haloechinothrix alba]
MAQRAQAKVVIVGTGFGGLGQAIQLTRAGITDFIILEKAHEVGGTWRDNSYPGCACDIQSHMYSFSYEQNPEWSRAFSGQPEIFEYLRGVAAKHGLYEKIHFGVEMAGARWDEDEGRWYAYSTTGDEYVGQFLVSGVGGLHIPQIPELPGIERFRGPTFHSARWDHDVDLEGKRVAVVGTGASAIQFVPRIAPEVAGLAVFQRTPPWIMPKPDHAMPEWTRSLFRSVPAVQRAYRYLLYWMLEVRAVGFNGHPALMKAGELLAKRHIRKHVGDPQLRAKLTPDYTMGCKRVLISNDYYPALTRDNVDVVTEGVREVREHSVVDTAGVEHPADVLIYGTGFHVTDAFDYLDITGAEGRNLAKVWQEEGMQTHNGITVAGFPNLFFLLGPNTALGHNSVVFMIEQQAKYVVDAVRLADAHDAAALDVRKDVQERFQNDIQRKLSNGVWTTGGCTSWYLDSQGVNRTIWPGFTWRYWLKTRKVDPSEYQVIGRGGSVGPAAASAAGSTAGSVRATNGR